MVFGFFSRRQPTQTDLSSSASIPLPETPRPSSPEPLGKDASPQIHTQVEQLQLRTPSPSIADSMSAAQGARPPSEVPVAAPEPEVTRTPVEPTPESLTTLITSVPAKILHEYTLTNIPLSEQPVLDALAFFFATLSPPPSLHCVRCHKDFVEVENDDRSCLVPHDDESAEVERVGRKGYERRTKEGTVYETLWGCCGKTTEGDGGEGPPDGWCYEGKHTVDIKRARFRADSTPQDDRLVSCLRLNCHGIRSRMPRASSSRKRARQTYKEQSSDEDESEGEADSGIDEIVGKNDKTTAKPNAKGKGKQKEVEKEKNKDDDKMDVDEDNASKAGSAAQRQSTPTTAPPKRPRGRPRKSLPADASITTPDSAKVPKRRGRPPKTKATVDDSEPESARGRKSANASPVRSVVERRQTRSISRTRVESSASPNAFRQTHKPKSRSRTKLGEVLNGEASDSGEADDEQPKKKRKVSA